MAKIITIHSFRNGVGRSTLIVNLAALLAIKGQRVGVIETNIQMPSLHILFGLNEHVIHDSFTAYLCGECNIDQTVYYVTPQLGSEIAGELFFVPANSPSPGIALTFQYRHWMERLHTVLRYMIAEFGLDVLLIDPSSGLTEESLYCMNFSDMMVVVARPDRQDYQGTGLLVEILQKIDPARVMVLVNDASFTLDFHGLREYIHKQYNCLNATVVPHSEKILALGSSDVFVLRYPDDPLTELYQQIADRLLI